MNWCGETDLAALVAVLARAALLVSNDSGAMHVMAALGRPQVAIFGSTSPVWTGPLNERAAVLHAGEPCSPCFRRTCRHGHYRCLREIAKFGKEIKDPCGNNWPFLPENVSGNIHYANIVGALPKSELAVRLSPYLLRR